MPCSFCALILFFFFIRIMEKYCGWVMALNYVRSIVIADLGRQAGWRQSLWKVMNLWMNCSGKGSIKMWVSLYALGVRRKKLSQSSCQKNNPGLWGQLNFFLVYCRLSSFFKDWKSIQPVHFPSLNGKMYDNEHSVNQVKVRLSIHTMCKYCFAGYNHWGSNSGVPMYA